MSMKADHNFDICTLGHLNISKIRDKLDLTEFISSVIIIIVLEKTCPYLLNKDFYRRLLLL